MEKLRNTKFVASLESGSKKHRCPQCGKKSLTRYVNNSTGEYLPDKYGYCDKRDKCAYHADPYKDGFISALKQPQRNQPQEQRRRFFIPDSVLRETLKGYSGNTFIANLLSSVPYPLELQDVREVIAAYALGTICSGYMKGAITFPFIDKDGNIRAIQVKQFDQTNHTTGTNFLHSIIERDCKDNGNELPAWLSAYNTNEEKVSCLFGEHLLKRYPKNPIALVEAPKTAIYGTLYFGMPKNDTDLIWLAVYNVSSLSLNKCSVLKNRNVFLFPDLSTDGRAFDLWDARASEFHKVITGATFTTIDLLEKYATEAERTAGTDLADILIKKDWRTFRQRQKDYPVNDWSFITDTEIAEMQDMLKGIFQRNEIRLPDGVTDAREFAKLHFIPLRERKDISLHVTELIKFVSLN